MKEHLCHGPWCCSGCGLSSIKSQSSTVHPSCITLNTRLHYYNVSYTSIKNMVQTVHRATYYLYIMWRFRHVKQLHFVMYHVLMNDGYEKTIKHRDILRYWDVYGRCLWSMLPKNGKIRIQICAVFDHLVYTMNKYRVYDIETMPPNILVVLLVGAN